MNKKQFSFYIAGLKFHQYNSVNKIIKEGDHLQLEAEPENKFDPNAVKIIYNLQLGDTIEPMLIGYVPMRMSRSKDIAAALNHFGEYICVVTKHLPEAPPYERLKVLVEFSDE